MKKLSYLLFIVLMTYFVFSCTSDGTSSVKRSRAVDYSDLTIYAGPSPISPVEYWKDSQGNDITNRNTLRNSLMNRYFGVIPQSERTYVQNISFEFANGRVTYKNENPLASIHSVAILDENFNPVVPAERQKIGQIVSTYEYRGDSLYIDLPGGRKFLAAGRTNTGDTLLISRGLTFWSTSLDTLRRVDTTRTVDLNILLDYAGYTSLNDMAVNDTIVYCNPKYKIY